MSESETASAPFEPGAPEPEGAEDSIRSIIARAMAGDEGATETTENPEAGATSRDANGRFAAAEKAEGETDETDQPAPTAEEPETPAITPPQAWSGPDKEKFATLPRDVQEIIQRRESDIAKGFQERAKPLKEYEAIQEVLAPFAANYRTQGYTDTDAIRMWATVAGELRRDPPAAIRSLIQAHGLTPEQILGRTADSQSYVAPQNDPRDERITRLEREMQRRDEESRNQQAQSITSNIEKFAADPSHPHFDAVHVHMGALMQAGVASDMAAAYEMAVHANPETRAKVQEAARVVSEAKRTADAKVAAEKARKAGSSVRGSPPLSNGALMQGGERSVRQEIEAAIAALS